MKQIKFINDQLRQQVISYVLPQYPTVTPPCVASGEVETHDVVIVGGGLSGLTLACSLAQLGIQAVMLDEDNTVGVKGASSRGICYTQKSLEIFDKLGIYKRIKAKGIEWSVGRTFAGEDEVYRFDLKDQANFNLSEQPPFINIQQFYNEAYLVDRINEFDSVALRWGNKLTSLTAHTPSGLQGKPATSHIQQGLQLGVQTDSGSYRINARYVIDCTGSNSPIRKWLDVPFTAKRGSDRWCIADVRFKTQPPTERHTWIEAPFNDNRAVWQHLMGDGVWRIDYQMAPDADPAYVSREDVVRERLERQFGKGTDGKGVEVDIVWVGPYAYRSECVGNMIHAAAPDLSSAVFLMGDSAKVVSPFGARGGNTGIADADNLAWKLAAVLRQQSPPSLLQTYQQERHEAAVENVKVTNRTARYLRPEDGMERIFRTATIELAKKYPFARSLINTGRMAIANPYTKSTICDTRSGASGTAGISVQNVAFKWLDGSAGSVNDLLRWADGNLLVLVFGKLSKVQALHLGALASSIGPRAAQVLASDQVSDTKEALQDASGKLQQACKIQLIHSKDTPAWAIIRPDSYLAANGAGIDSGLIRAVQMAMGI
jgi:3-(3-hydroxy-phenyl)propionate hydroxylase